MQFTTNCCIVQIKNFIIVVFFTFLLFFLSKIDKNIVDGVIVRLKKLFQVKNDFELADALGITQQRLSAWKTRGSIDISVLLSIPGISLDALFDLQQNVESKIQQYDVLIEDVDELISPYIRKIEKLEGQVELLKELLKEKDERILEMHTSEELKKDKLKRVADDRLQGVQQA